MEPVFSQKLKWYQTTWGVVVLGLGILIVVVGSIFVGLTIHYYIKIKQGEASILAAKFPSGPLTQSVNRDTLPHLSRVDRKDLEEGDFPYLGSSQPKVVIVEFIDFKCPYCKAMLPTMEQIIGRYGNKVKLIIRQFPAESIHPGATQLAQIAHCAKAQGRFWNVFSYFYAHQDDWGGVLNAADIETIARQNQLDLSRLKTCVAHPSTLVAVNKDYAAGYKAGVAGTPTFFINGERVEGVINFKVWEEFFKQF